jgi:hypothetical protein
MKSKSQPKFGVEVGGIDNEMFVSNLEVCPKFSYRIGGFINYDKFGGSGIYYVRKGAKLSDFLPQYAGYIQKLDISMNYIELVPISLRFETLIKEDNTDFKIVPTLSLYGEYGFSGKGTITGLAENGNTFSKQINNPFKDSQFTNENVNYSYKGFKNFDIGGKIGFDFIYKNKYVLRLNYTGGFINISPYDKKFKNNSLDFSLCYLFNK